MVTAITSRLMDDAFAEHARWVAIIVANGAVMESELEGIYGAVLGLAYHESKITYYAIQNWPARRNSITSAINYFYRDTEIEKQWIDLLAELKTAYQIRNSTAHAVWAEDPKTHQLQLRQTNVSGVYSHPKNVMPVHNLKQNSERIAQVSAKLNELQLLIRSGRVVRKQPD